MPVAESHVVEVAHTLSERDLAQVLAVIDEAAAVDGVDPFSEQSILHLGEPSDQRILLVRDANDPSRIVGVAYVDGDAGEQRLNAELVVHPDSRRQGIASALTQKLIDLAPDQRVQLWAHGTHPGAQALARSLGFDRTRVLLQMTRLLDDSLPEARIPTGIAIRTFRPGRDDEAWLELNARAFQDHPEQGSWTGHDLALRVGQPWFDPAGFFLAARAGQLVGFHWTKIHGKGVASGQSHSQARMGEVYIVGVDPSEQGHGLGAALTIIGLKHLHASGVATAMLYVDEANQSAIGLYESLGFTTWKTDVSFRH